MRKFVLASAFVLGCAPQATTAVPAVTKPEIAELDVLRLYDQAGFPSVSGLRFLQRTTPMKRGFPICRRGFELWRGTDPIFLESTLDTSYGRTLVDGIHPAMLARTPPPSLTPGMRVRQARVNRRGRVPSGPTTETPLPLRMLRAPHLGSDAEPIESGCSQSVQLSDTADAMVRARWAQMSGLPGLADEIIELSGIREDPKASERLVRRELTHLLTREAAQSMYTWLPRREVAEILRRAAAVAGRQSYAAELRAQAERLAAVDVLERGPEPHKIAQLLPEQPNHPGRKALLFDGRERRGDDVLRSPTDELNALGRAGVELLVSRLADETWTRTPCTAGPCTVGELARFAVSLYAAQEFQTPDAVRQWWSRAREQTDEEFLRESLASESSFRSKGAERLRILIGPRVIEAVDRVDEPDGEFLDAIARAFFEHRDEIVASAALRSGYAAFFAETVPMVRFDTAEALEAWAQLEPADALRWALALFDEEPEDFEHWDGLVAAVRATGHPPTVAAIKGALRTMDESAWEAITEHCGVGEPDCPREITSFSRSLLRRDLARDVRASQWASGAADFEVYLAQGLLLPPEVLDADEDFGGPLASGALLATRRLVGLGRPAPLRPPAGRGATNRIVRIHTGGSPGPALKAGRAWLAHYRGKRVTELQTLAREHKELAAKHPEQVWALVLVRYEGRGIVAHLDVAKDGFCDGAVVQYADADGSTDVWLHRRGANAAVRALFAAAAVRWDADPSHPVTEFSATFCS